MSPGVWVALAAVVLALGLGLYRAATDGRFRGTHRVRGASAGRGSAGRVDPVRCAGRVDPARDERGRIETPGTNTLAGTPWQEQLGERATLLQFSSAFCAPCRATRRVLADVADRSPGVVHLDVDAEHHLDVVRRLGVLRTPTTLILDAGGRELARAGGVPTKDVVERALSGL